jgi:sigma-B regulation protein RsbU (phosphoserine phosphatase)
LIVDDDELFRDVLTHALETAGHELVTAASAAEGLNVLRANADIGMVICDWEMPVMSGPEFCRAVRAARWGRDVYIIMLSSRGPEYRLDGLYAGADDYLDKPFDLSHLLASIRAGRNVVAQGAD